MPSSTTTFRLLHKTRATAGRVVVEIVQDGPVTFQRELVKCGKPKCRRCRSRPTHGPYWYAYKWKPGRYGSMGEGRTVSKYIGKTLDPSKAQFRGREDEKGSK